MPFLISLRQVSQCNLIVPFSKLNKLIFTTMNNIYLEAKHIVKQFVNHTALNNVSIQVPEGKIFGLLGPNGAGKTTLIRIINHITAPDAGEILIQGQPLTGNDVFNIGYLPEERGRYKKMKVGEQAVYLAQLKGMDKKMAERELKVWFDKFDIAQWWNKKLEELSKGMQQKIQFIITVVHKPQLLIFDEPFSGFDPVNAELLKKEILELKQKGHTIIFSTHNMESVEEICDNIALINHSQVVLQGNVNEIRSQHKSGIFNLTLAHGQTLPQSPLYDITSSECDEWNSRYTIKKETDITNSALIQEIAQHVEVSSFSEYLPSMNEIFISTVSNQQ